VGVKVISKDGIAFSYSENAKNEPDKTGYQRGFARNYMSAGDMIGARFPAAADGGAMKGRGGQPD
jgi:hypothetical protein